MKPIRVYLQYPWKFPDSPYYKYLIENPPKGIEYLNVGEQKGVIMNKSFFHASNFLKRFIRSFIKISKIPVINAHQTKTGLEYNLIHCAHCLSKNDSSWVADFESAWQIWASGKRTKLTESITRKILLNKNCKKIIAWTIQTKEEIEKIFPEIKDKIEIVYPAIPIPKINIKEKKDKITLLFSARYFYKKGGLDSLRALDALTKKYPKTEAIVVSEVPKKILEKYSNNKKINFFPLMSQKKFREEIYPQADIIIYPGYSDTFGFMILEAMSFGIPIISVGGIARTELIEEGRTGFIIPLSKKPNAEKVINGKYLPPSYLGWSIKEIEMTEKEEIITGIVKKASQMIESPKLMKEMSKNCIEMIKNGKFSIENRNKKLIKIYEEAIK